MKKILLMGALLLSSIGMNAQVMRAEELEVYAKEKYGDKWVEAAANLGKTLTLDKNNGITYTQVIEAPGKTKEQLYILINYWYTSTFGSGTNIGTTLAPGSSGVGGHIELNDKEAGVIIGKGYLPNVAGHMGGMTRYAVSLTPIIKTDIKPGKIRVTYTIQSYEASKVIGGGILGMMSSARYEPAQYETWMLDQCYPFAEKDSHKKASAKALIMAHAYSNVIMDKIEEAVKHGMTGTESDDW